MFDLRCAGEHVFEAWFASSDAFAQQQAAGQVECPLCGSAEVDKAVMAPRLAAKGNQLPAVPPAKAKAAIAAMAAMQAKLLEHSTWVGGQFAEQARAMHAGEAEHATIHGQATLAEAKALVDDGVPVAPLPLPVVPPKVLN